MKILLLSRFNNRVISSFVNNPLTYNMKKIIEKSAIRIILLMLIVVGSSLCLIRLWKTTVGDLVIWIGPFVGIGTIICVYMRWKQFRQSMDTGFCTPTDSETYHQLSSKEADSKKSVSPDSWAATDIKISQHPSCEEVSSKEIVNPDIWAPTDSKTYHHPSCEEVSNKKSVRVFSSVEEALGYKYTPCAKCNPQK